MAALHRGRDLRILQAHEVSARVEILPPLIVMRSPAATVMLPVTPEPVLSALIRPPLITLTWLPALTLIAPPAPPPLVLVSSCPPLTVMLPTFAVIVPAFPAPVVLAEILAPLATVALPPDKVI